MRFDFSCPTSLAPCVSLYGYDGPDDAFHRRLLCRCRLIVEEGGFLYDADAYNDDLPFWNTEYGKPHLVIPYTLDVNDMRFATPQGFNSGDQFFAYLRDSVDFLLEVQ